MNPNKYKVKAMNQNRVEAVECVKCHKIHAVSSEDYFKIIGSIMVGDGGGIYGAVIYDELPVHTEALCHDCLINELIKVRETVRNRKKVSY